VTQHAGTTYVRMCGQLYNIPEHYDRLAAALREVLLEGQGEDSDGHA
jgi:hypothetical protein